MGVEAGAGMATGVEIGVGVGDEPEKGGKSCYAATAKYAPAIPNTAAKPGQPAQEKARVNSLAIVDQICLIAMFNPNNTAGGWRLSLA